jgi:hypothetical protein
VDNPVDNPAPEIETPQVSEPVPVDTSADKAKAAMHAWVDSFFA